MTARARCRQVRRGSSAAGAAAEVGAALAERAEPQAKEPAAVRRGGAAGPEICHRGFGRHWWEWRLRRRRRWHRRDQGRQGRRCPGSGGNGRLGSTRFAANRRAAWRMQARVRDRADGRVLAATNRCSARTAAERARACRAEGARREWQCGSIPDGGGADGVVVLRHSRHALVVRWRRSGHLLFVRMATCFASATSRGMAVRNPLDALRRRHSPHRRRSRNARRGSTSLLLRQYGQRARRTAIVAPLSRHRRKVRDLVN